MLKDEFIWVHITIYVISAPAESVNMTSEKTIFLRINYLITCNLILVKEWWMISSCFYRPCKCWCHHLQLHVFVFCWIIQVLSWITGSLLGKTEFFSDPHHWMPMSSLSSGSLLPLLFYLISSPTQKHNPASKFGLISCSCSFSCKSTNPWNPYGSILSQKLNFSPYLVNWVHLWPCQSVAFLVECK